MKPKSGLILFLIFALFSCQQKNISDRDLSFVKMLKMTEIDSEINETSALVFYNSALFTINDSGGEPIVYQIDTVDYKIDRRIVIQDVVNVDWESLAINNSHFFIGDFGNNKGDRADLSIFFFDKTFIDSSYIIPEQIRFKYANYYKPKAGVHSTQFDAESMIAFEDTIWIFTKAWEKQNTSIYKLPIESGDFVLEPWRTLNVEGLITGACFGNKTDEIWLTGYKNYKAYLWKLNYNESLQTIEIVNKWGLLVADSIQNEGICMVDGRLLISSEKSATIPAAIYEVQF